MREYPVQIKHRLLLDLRKISAEIVIGLDRTTGSCPNLGLNLFWGEGPHEPTDHKGRTKLGMLVLHLMNTNSIKFGLLR